MATRHRGARLYGALALMVVLAAVVFWVVGFLPWVLAGFALPGGDATGPAAGLAGVRLAVPLVVTRLPELAAESLAAGVLAGLVPIAFPRLSRLLGVVVTGSVVLATASAVLVVSRRALELHAPAEFASDTRVVQGLVLTVVTGALLGLAVGLAATVRHGLVAVAAGIVAAMLPVWFVALVPSAGRLGAEAVAGAALAAGLAVSVHRTRWSLLLWPLGVAAAWLGAPLAAATRYGATHLQPGGATEVGPLLRGATRAAADALAPAAQPWWAWAAAVVVGLAWLTVHRPPREEPAGVPAATTPEPERAAGPETVGAVAPGRGKHTATRRG